MDSLTWLNPRGCCSIGMEDLVSTACEESISKPYTPEDLGPSRAERSFGAPSEMSLEAKATLRVEGLVSKLNASPRDSSQGRVVAENHRVTESFVADMLDGRDKERFGETQRFFNCVTPDSFPTIQTAGSHQSPVPRGNFHSSGHRPSVVVGMANGVIVDRAMTDTRETQRFFNCVTPSTGHGTTPIHSAVC